jgi:AraC-like DNA-binding protein
MKGDDLVDRAHMSPSTFRQHFRALTGVSPLQYQKQLRLQEARQSMLNENLDAGSAAVHVGYESASQFSREYSRLVWRSASSAISRACGSLPLTVYLIVVERWRERLVVERSATDPLVALTWFALGLRPSSPILWSELVDSV